MMCISDKETFLKMVVKIVFFGGLAVFLIYYVLRITSFDQGRFIDNTITYTSDTVTYTSIYSSNFTPSVQDVVDSIPKYVTVPEGGLDWKLFAKTKSIPYMFEDGEGQEQYGVKPEFSEALQKLDGQDITMQGYMFPLMAVEDQSMFLFGPFPVTCPYHYHIGPALVMEAYGVENIEFSYEAVTLKGTLELVPREDNYNIFYRFKNVRLVE